MLIFPISWSGRGALVPVFALVAIIAGLVIAFFTRAPGAGLGTVGPWPFAAGFAAVGALSLPLGLWMNRPSARGPVGPRAGAVGPAPHRFCGLAMPWWSVLMLAFAGLLLTAEEPQRPPREVGAVLRKD